MLKNDTLQLIFILLFITILCMMYMIYKICDSDESLNYYIYDSKNPGQTVVIIGGTHGNEPIGSIAIHSLIEKLNNNSNKLKTGKLILIPDVNYCGLKLGIRFIPGIGDLNRKYPILNNDYTGCPITDKIINLIKDADFILDFHEGWGFHRIDNSSMGSTITPTETNNSNRIADILYDNINKIINIDYKKFKIFVNDDRYISNPEKYSKINDINGSLRYFANIKKKDYVLIEITGQNNIQTIEVRKLQADLIIENIMKIYKLI